MAELDHIVYASADVDAGAAYIEELTGANAVTGGPHEGRGTHNRLLTFDDRTYFEIIGIDPAQPTPDLPMAFGLHEDFEPALVAYAIHPVQGETLESISQVIHAAGFDPGSIAGMSRRKPDGELLEWRLTHGGDTGAASDGALPFAIDWLGRPSPAASLPSMGTLQKLAVSHPNTQVGEVIAALGLTTIIEFTTGPAKLAATIDSPSGTVELR